MHKKKIAAHLLCVCIVTSALFDAWIYTVPLTSAQEIQYGGRLVVGFTNDVRSICTAHPDWEYTGIGCILDLILYDHPWWYYRIEDFDPNATLLEPVCDPPVPWFFIDWEVSEDGKVWTVHIPHNATFHDGEPVTAEDVQFTADVVCRELPYMNYKIVGLNHTEVVDDYTVRFYMNCPRAMPPMEFGYIFPKHIWEPYQGNLTLCPNEGAIGSGPFKLKEWKRGEYWWFEAFEDYWKGRPYIDELVFRIFPTTEALAMAMKKGEVDMTGYGGVDYATALDLMKDPNIDLAVCPGIGTSWLSINVHPNKTDPLARDKRVRKALAYAIDYDSIINIAYMGFAEKADSWIYEELPSHNPNLPQYEYNVTLANKILDDAGYIDIDGDGIREWEDEEGIHDFEFDFYTGTDELSLREAEIFRENFAAIGIKINVISLHYSEFSSIVYNPQDCVYDIAAIAEEPGPNPEWIWDMAKSWEPGSWNAAGWVNETFDELYYAQMGEANLTKRNQIWWKMEEIMAEELPYIFYCRGQQLCPYRTDKFAGFVPAMGGLSVWVNSLTYHYIHLKKAPTPGPGPTPGPTSLIPWIIAGVCIVVAVVSIIYAVRIRSRLRKSSAPARVVDNVNNLPFY